MDILWKKTPLSVCILLYAVENSLFSVEKSTEFVAVSYTHLTLPTT